MARITLERIVSENTKFVYSGLPKQWQVADIKGFAAGKELYSYQINALERIASVLYLAFGSANCDKPNIKNIQIEYLQYGVSPEPNNRACFWMATGSGKTLVLIKTIEHINYLMELGLIPKKEIMLLLPKDNLIKQFKEEVATYNQLHSVGKTISLKDLSKYEEEKWSTATFLSEIKVYYYRSDLLRDEKKETILDYKAYENDGNWYVFLDEAHRGDSENSNLKFYINQLSSNGFLFNFSATFTDDIDIITTCYNFNLEKFINAGYGKNIYLSSSIFALDNSEDAFSKKEKQKQVLKSFILFAIIAKSRNNQSYHNPLIMTLVNSVSKTEKRPNSDLKLFCNYMLKIAQEDSSIMPVFEEAKKELIDEFASGKSYIFGKEKLIITSADILRVTLEAVRTEAFNSKTRGDLEYYEGVKGKEIVFKLQTSPSPFALIRIGDTAAFINNYLKGYQKLTTFQNRDWFSELNQASSTIKVLLGSRAFYEGWDSNRPNIINYINIGKGEARKFVPQSIGRGVRIQPDLAIKNNRKRLPINNPNKNKLLETLFIFSTDASSVKAILGSMAQLIGKSIEPEFKKLYDQDPSIFELTKRTFELLLPVYKEKKLAFTKTIDFYIEDGCKQRLQNLIDEMSPATFLLSTNKSYRDNWDVKKLIALKEFMQNNKFVSDPIKDFRSYDYLVSDLRKHILTSEKGVEGVRPINENAAEEKDNDIIHFKYITVDLSDEKRKDLIDLINTVKNYGKLTQEEIDTMHPTDISKINDVGYLIALYAEKEKLLGKESAEFVSNELTLSLRKLSNHYYQPFLYPATGSIGWIKHIVREKSEFEFIKNLLSHIKKDGEKINSEWMFSKVDETLDKNIAMPYFADNQYKNFFPDFIFWIKNGSDYKIVFVDPKSSAFTNYEQKVDGFEKLFKGKEFKFKDKYNVRFELKLVTDDYQGGDKYAQYWIKSDNFSWLK